MSHQEYSLYDEETGLFIGTVISVHPDQLAANSPPGLGLMAGVHDHLSKRVNLESREVAEYQPPRPSLEHEWDDKAKRWLLTASAQASAESDRQARAAILAQEVTTARALREGLLEVLPIDSPVRLKLQAAEDAIAAERPKVKRI